jgi:hypothetical protein
MSGSLLAHTILARAQESVDRWHTHPTQRDFALAMEAETWMYWTPSSANATERDAFRQVADAIHRGEGTVLSTPDRLLRIAHAVLDAEV